MALTNEIAIKIYSLLTSTSGIADIQAKIESNIENDLTTDVCDVLYSVTGTISGGSNDIDLSGTLEDPLGNAITFAEVMMVFIRNNGDNAMTVGGSNNIPLMANTSDLINLASDAYFCYIDQAGITVTAGTGDLITITGTNDDTYDIVVIGSST